MTLPKTILCAVDFSPGSRHALVQALELADRFRARILVMHAVPTLDHVVEYGLIGKDAAELTTGMLDAAEKKLQEFVDATDGPKGNLELIACFGDAPAAICEQAEEKGVDLIVLSTRGLTGLKHMVLGSTAERVVRVAPCAVWTTHGPGE